MTSNFCWPMKTKCISIAGDEHDLLKCGLRPLKMISIDNIYVLYWWKMCLRHIIARKFEKLINDTSTRILEFLIPSNLQINLKEPRAQAICNNLPSILFYGELSWEWDIRRVLVSLWKLVALYMITLKWPS